VFCIVWSEAEVLVSCLCCSPEQTFGGPCFKMFSGVRPEEHRVKQCTSIQKNLQYTISKYWTLECVGQTKVLWLTKLTIQNEHFRRVKLIHINHYLKIMLEWSVPCMCVWWTHPLHCCWAWKTHVPFHQIPQKDKRDGRHRGWSAPEKTINKYRKVQSDNSKRLIIVLNFLFSVF